MNITIHQIHTLLRAYNQHLSSNRFLERKVKERPAPEELVEDKVIISAEAKRAQVYQKMAEDVLKRITSSTPQQGDRSPEEALEEK